MKNSLRVCAALAVSLVVGCNTGDPQSDSAETESAIATDGVPTTTVCGPPAKVLRWITPFASLDATNQILDSDIGLAWKLRLGGGTSTQYLAWVASVAGLMKI